MLNKKMSMYEKENSSLITNDGWIISEMFCNPLKIRSELNKNE